MKKYIWQIVFLASTVFFLASCKPFKLSTLSIAYPVNNATYIGTVNNPPPVNPGGITLMQGSFKVNYTSSPGAEINIILNGHKIGQYFVYGPVSAVGDIEKFKQFFRHGENTLAVDPLGFGPSLKFNLDMVGPTVIITRGQVIDAGANVEIEGKLRDYSLISNQLKLNLVQITGYQANGKLNRAAPVVKTITVNADGTFCACGASKISIAGLVVKDNPATPAVNEKRSLLYSFIAKDIYGFETGTEYLADNDAIDTLAVDNAVRVAVGDTFIESMRPIVASAMYGMLKAAPLDIRDVAWNDRKICGAVRGTILDKNISQATEDEVTGTQAIDCSAVVPTPVLNDGGVLPAGINPLDIPLLGLNFQGHINKFYMHDGSAKTVGSENLLNKTGTILLNGFKIQANNMLDLKLVITEMLLSMRIQTNVFLIGDIIIDLDIYIARTDVDTDVLVTAVNKKVTTELQNSNIGLSPLVFDKLSVKVGFLTINLGGLVNTIEPLIHGLIGGMLPGIINPVLQENLQKIVIGGVIAQPENQTKFNMNLNVADLHTDSIATGYAYDLLVGLESIADVKVADAFVKPALGPIFYDDPINPDEVFNAYGNAGTNMTVAVNSNLINQSLAAVYAIGVSHFTSHNGVTYYGANPATPVDPTDLTKTKTLAKEGDVRIRLWPDMPPAINFQEISSSGGTGLASIKYDSAQLYMDILRKNATSGLLEWQTDLQFQVNFDLAITINELNGTVTLGAGGPPVFKINKMINNTNFQVPAAVIQGVLDAALFLGGDALADQFIVLDLNALAAGSINGTEVRYLADTDKYIIASGKCLKFDSEGAVIPSADYSLGTDKKYDEICQTINFVVKTDTVGVIGDKGTNLFFQMQARDPKIPPAPALPRLDLDQDGLVDYQDNCKVPNDVLSKAVTAAGGTIGNIDVDGKPIGAFEDNVRTKANNILSCIAGGGTLAGCDGVAAATTPGAIDVDWYNSLRLGDATISNPNWLKMYYSNINQLDSDIDGVGELCEDDVDRDGVYTSNGTEKDNCVSTYNPDQLDSYAPTNSGPGDVCNPRQTYVLLKNKNRALRGLPACITHGDFNKIYSGGEGYTGTASVSPSDDNSGDGFRYMGWSDCNPYDTKVRFYMKEDTAAPKRAGFTEVVFQFWSTEDRTKFGMHSSIAGTGSPKLPADDIVVSTGTYYDTNNWRNWILTLNALDDAYPYFIESYKVSWDKNQRWCIFEKDKTAPRVNIPDMDANNCNDTYTVGGQKATALFQILVGSGQDLWKGNW